MRQTTLASRSTGVTPIGGRHGEGVAPNHRRGIALERDGRESGARNRVAVLALATAGSLWGASFLFGKLALEDLGVTHLTLLRFGLASLALLPYALAKRVRPKRRDLPLFLLAGFLTVPATFLVQFAGLSLTSASVAALMVGTLPPMIALAASVLYQERLGRVGWMAVGLSSVGVVLTVGAPGATGNDWLGDALVLLSLLAVVGWTMLGKRLVRTYPPVAATAYIFAFGTLTLLPISLLWEGVPSLNLPPGAWVSVAMLGIACSAITNGLWNWGLRYVPASRAGVYLNLEPLVGVLLGVVVLGERLGPLAVLGGALILAGAALASRKQAES